MLQLTDFQTRVYEATSRIPRGRVATYAQIARTIGKPSASRAVGNALNKNPFAPKVPCHRVVRSDLSVGGFAQGSKKKILLLKKEGVRINSGKILPKSLFRFK
jgi:methylated-DNA-[protein]-cysteine S-methyltransferase